VRENVSSALHPANAPSCLSWAQNMQRARHPAKGRKTGMTGRVGLDRFQGKGRDREKGRGSLSPPGSLPGGKMKVIVGDAKKILACLKPIQYSGRQLCRNRIEKDGTKIPSAQRRPERAPQEIAPSGSLSFFRKTPSVAQPPPKTDISQLED
jgi:hypothetical protein